MEEAPGALTWGIVRGGHQSAPWLKAMGAVWYGSRSLVPNNKPVWPTQTQKGSFYTAFMLFHNSERLLLFLFCVLFKSFLSRWSWFMKENVLPCINLKEKRSLWLKLGFLVVMLHSGDVRWFLFVFAFRLELSRLMEDRLGIKQKIFPKELKYSFR